MSLPKALKMAEKYIFDNSTSILTGIAVAGTVTTAFLTGKASFAAACRLSDAYASGHYIEEPTKREKFDIIWKLYIPAVTTGVLTCASIVAVNRIGTRRAAAMAAAYKLSETAFSEYKEKLIETIGEKKAQKVATDVIQDRASKSPDVEREILDEDDTRERTYDSLTGRYFWSDAEIIRKAQNTVNEKIINNNYASLSEFYTELGLAPTTYSEEVGWNVDRLLDVEVHTILDHKNRPCLALDYRVEPIRGYYRIH